MTLQEMLFEQYGRRGLIPLSEVSEALFGITPGTAADRFYSGKLDFPLVKLYEAKGAPLYVTITALAKTLEEKTEKQMGFQP